MTRYLIPILTLKDNGGGAVALSFARALREKGNKVVVLSSGFHGDAALNRAENCDLDFVVSPVVWGGGRLMAASLFFLYAIAYSLIFRPRLVYTHMVTGIIPDFSGCRPIMLAQDIEYRFYSLNSRFIAKKLFIWVTGRARLIVSSLWLERFFKRRKLDILYAADVGISKSFFGNQGNVVFNQRTIDFLLIAKRGAHKRYNETCNIAALLANKGFNVTLIDQVASNNYKSSPMLTVLGAQAQTDIRALYQKTKIFIGISRAEGYGLTPLEALSQGCHVITSPTPSTLSIRNAALNIIYANEDLMVECVEFASDIHANIVANSDKWNFSYSGPYMETWASAAASEVIQNGAQ